MSAATIHPTAIVDATAELAEDVVIGPYAIVGPSTVLGAGTSVGAHSMIDAHTTLGRENRVFQFASVGAEPQDLKFSGEATTLTLGDRNTIREFCTLNRGTIKGGGATRVGNDNLFMAYSHVAHDCLVGNGVVMANGATLAGHVTVEDAAIVGGLVAVHQFVRIGAMAMLGGGAMVSLDVPPFCIAAGDRAKLHGLNLIGLRRRGLSEGAIKSLRTAYRLLFQGGLKLKDALARIREEHADVEEVMTMVHFIENSERGICR
ncbi:MAG: UDP-N-acetylglucosamine acyltransferase [Hyphomicrobiaceae bacterium]|jgi:UDP-N-acetylglucosamine acyltransferase